MYYIVLDLKYNTNMLELTEYIYSKWYMVFLNYSITNLKMKIKNLNNQYLSCDVLIINIQFHSIWI